MNEIFLILYAYRWWIAAWIGFMAVVGIMEKKGRKKAPAATGIAERRTTKKSINIIHLKTRSVKM